MKSWEENWPLRWIFICILIGCCVFVGTRAWAGGDRITQDTEVTTDVDITGNISNSLTGGDNTASNSASIGGSRAYGVGMGDVDIAQCMASKSTPIYQWLKFNKWCWADTLDAKGLHDAAAKTRCSIPQYVKIFDTHDQCITLSTAKVFHVEPQPAAEEDDGPDRHVEEFNALYARVTAIESQRQSEADKARKAAQRAREAAKRAEKAEQDRIAADEERRAYVQQTLEELKEWK